MHEVTLRESIPESELPYPEDRWGRVKYRVWEGVYPYYESIRDTLLRMKLIRHSGRQRHLLGKLAPGRSMEDFLKHLEAQGFGNHFVAWHDDDELAGLRKPDGFRYQYHLRIYADREVRGHYEYTPEAHPIRHLGTRHMKNRNDDFKKFCGDWIT